MNFIDTLDDLERERYLKVQRLRERGINPYPLRSSRTHTIQQVRDLYEKGEDPGAVRLVGRITANRWTGKITFADIRDGTERIQLFLRQDNLGEETYKNFLKDYDLGDFVQVEGTLFRTKTGEITVNVTKIELLAKAIAPMPEKWHGLKDVETRYRQRYLDLMVNEQVREVFRARARIVTAMRAYLDRNDFIEVETPALQPLYGGAFAKPFVTYHNELERNLYLRIADELYLKRLLVGMFERVYEISKDFRNEGVDATHLPEFTMMECYQAFGDLSDMMKVVEDIFVECAMAARSTLQITYGDHNVDLTPPFARVAMRDAILEKTGIDIYVDDTFDALHARIEEKQLRVEPQISWGKLVEKLFAAYVEPTLIAPTFIIDFPVDISPFAKKKPGDARVTERFEVYVAGGEYGNAFTELNDPEDQWLRFVEQQKDRARGDVEALQMDDDYVQALKHGMPPTGGLGMGVDRLTMLLTNQHSIRDVVLYPQLRN
ncbi:MAG TPA: lysine--tRNA ligase [Anaerolineae bacterium]|nr:lysine--tRNA ligase [Anaerolineae bacterium]